MNNNFCREIKYAYEEQHLSQAAADRILAELKAGKPAGKAGGRMTRLHRGGIRRAAVIAAVVSVFMIFGVVAYAADWFGLKDVHLDEAADSEYYLISLQGAPESGEYEAANEWNSFVTAWLAGNTVTNDYQPQPKYYPYQVYSDEMAAKLDEICAKYALSLHGGFNEVGYCSTGDEAAMERFYSTMGTGRIFKDGCNIDFSGYYYDELTFQIDCGGYADSVGADELSFQLRRCVKGYMDDVYLNVQDGEGCEQWEYTTADGVTVNIALGSSQAVIYADRPESFVAVDILQSFSSDSMLTHAQMEAFAEMLDFSAIA